MLAREIGFVGCDASRRIDDLLEPTGDVAQRHHGAVAVRERRQRTAGVASGDAIAVGIRVVVPRTFGAGRRGKVGGSRSRPTAGRRLIFGTNTSTTRCRV